MYLFMSPCWLWKRTHKSKNKGKNQKLPSENLWRWVIYDSVSTITPFLWNPIKRVVRFVDEEHAVKNKQNNYKNGNKKQNKNNHNKKIKTTKQ